MDISPQDRDLIARTVLSEAGSEGDDGMTAVASVIKNRLASGDYGKSASEVVLSPNAFEAWSLPRRDPNNPSRWSAKNPDYQHAASIVDDVMSGKVTDPTGGADHYLNPKIVKARSGSLPDWAQGQPSAVIGRHSFYAPAEDLLGSWGKTQTAPPSNPTPNASPAAAEPDLLGTWGAAPAAKPAISINARPGYYASATAEETPAEFTARQMAAHQGSDWEDTAIRLGLGTLRGVGDVADTIGGAITGVGRYGAGVLQGAGVISPQTAGAVTGWADTSDARARAAQDAYDTAAATSPMATVGRLGGNLLATAPAIEALPLRLAGLGPVERTLATGVGAGATASALTSGVSDEPVGEQIATGAAMGGALGPLGYGASLAGRGLRSVLLGTIDPETAQLARAARDVHGIPVTAGQLTANPLARFADSVLQRLPFTGYGARAAEQQGALNRAISNTFGEDTDKISTQTISRAKSRIGQVFDDVANRTGPIAVDKQFLADMHNVEMQARSVLPATEMQPLHQQLRNIADTIDFPTGTIKPESYQALTRKDAPLSRAQQSKDPNVRFYANKVREALDDVMQRSAPPDAVQDLREARSQWKALKTVEPLAKKATTGDISPALLLGKVNTSYSGAGGDLGELGRIGQRFIKEPPSSGTSERLLAMKLGAAALGGLGLGGSYAFDPEDFQRNALIAGSVIAGGRGISAALRSNTLARLMIRDALSGARGYYPSTNLLARTAPAAALLARPALNSIGNGAPGQ